MRRIKYMAVCAALSVSILTGCTAAGMTAQEPAVEMQQKEGSEETVTEKQTYQSNHGWSVNYDPAQFTVNESGDDVSFVYNGESAGTSMVTISYIGAKQPEEVLYDVTSQWGDMENISRLEGYFPGTDDKWGYWRTIGPEEEGSGLSETAIAGEYNGGVLLFDLIVHVSGDESIDLPVSDALSELINTVQYESFEPQKMYEYIPGKYVQEYTDEIEGEKVTTEYSITLNDDHTGIISIQDDVDVIWETYEIKAANGSFAYEYAIEGDELLINFDGSWISFIKKGTAKEDVETDIYAGLWAEKSAERIILQIMPVDEEGWYDIEITWREDLPQKDVYDMRAHLQEDGSLYYDNCRYVIRTFEGDDFTDDIQYQSGSGLLYYDQDVQELYWTDYEVDPEENVTTFIRANFSEDSE